MAHQLAAVSRNVRFLASSCPRRLLSSGRRIDSTVDKKRYDFVEDDQFNAPSESLSSFLKKGSSNRKLAQLRKLHAVEKQKRKPNSFLRLSRKTKDVSKHVHPMRWSEAGKFGGPYEWKEGEAPQPVLKPHQAKEILNKYALGESLDAEDFDRVRYLLKQHPLYLSLVGKKQDVVQIKILRPRGFGGLKSVEMDRGESSGEFDVRAFFAVTSRGEYHHFSYRHCYGKKHRNLEKIFIETCKSVLEKSGLAKELKMMLQDLRMEEFHAGKVQQFGGKSWTVNWQSLCMKFAEENNIQVHNANMMAKLVYRNAYGYWNFTTRDAHDRFLLYFKKSLLTNEFLHLRFGNPNQFGGSNDYRHPKSVEKLKKKLELKLQHLQGDLGSQEQEHEENHDEQQESDEEDYLQTISHTKSRQDFLDN